MFDFASRHGLSPFDFAPDGFAAGAKSDAARDPRDSIVQLEKPADWNSLFDFLDEAEFRLLEIIQSRKTTSGIRWDAMDALDALVGARLQARLAIRAQKEKIREARQAA